LSDPLSPASIGRRARAAGLELDAGVCQRLAEHARSVRASNDLLHLTTVTDRAAFLERHLGESFEGAALLRESCALNDAVESGMLLDLGSGNGYPALPVALAHGLQPLLTEANRRKAEFLRESVGGIEGARVIDRQVQRPTDLGVADDVVAIDVITTRAMGSWEKVVPRFAPALRSGGAILVWAGESVAEVARRGAWKRLELAGRRALPGRERSWVWLFKTRS